MRYAQNVRARVLSSSPGLFPRTHVVQHIRRGRGRAWSAKSRAPLCARARAIELDLRSNNLRVQEACRNELTPPALRI